MAERLAELLLDLAEAGDVHPAGVAANVLDERGRVRCVERLAVRLAELRGERVGADLAGVARARHAASAAPGLAAAPLLGDVGDLVGEELDAGVGDRIVGACREV